MLLSIYVATNSSTASSIKLEKPLCGRRGLPDAARSTHVYMELREPKPPQQQQTNDQLGVSFYTPPFFFFSLTFRFPSPIVHPA